MTREVIVEKNLSLNENILKSIYLYPNPFSENVNISFDSLVDVSVYNINGNLVLKHESINALNTSNLNPGTYIFKIEHEGLETYIKMVK